MKAIIGKKVGMSQIFDENGHVIPVTVIEAGPCTVVQKKTSEKEGYNAVQLGYEDVAEKKLTKGEMGHLNKAGVSPKKHLREFDLDNAAELNIGDIVMADTFQVATSLISPVSARATAIRASSSAGAHSAPPPATAAAPSIVTLVPWAPLPIPPVSSRARSAPATWAWIR